MLTTALLIASLAAGQDENSSNAADIDVKIKNCQAERVETLERALEFAKTKYSQGTYDLDIVLKVQLELLDAKLDMADSLEEEIRVLTSQFEVANRFHVIARQRYEAGAASALDFLRAKATALRIQVELLKRQRVQKAALK